MPIENADCLIACCWRGWARRCALVLVAAWIAAACAARTAAPTIPAAAKYPDFVYPAVPPAMQSAETLQQIEYGWRYLQNGDTRNANREFAAALRHDPALYPARAGVGYVELATGNEAAALKAFDTVLQAQRSYVPALVGRGQALLGLERDADAIEAFEAALAADGSLASVRRRVEVLRFRNVQQVIEAARSAAAAGRAEEARLAYERALEISPESAFLFRELAIVERRLGNADRALEHFTRAADLDPSDTASLIGIGDILTERQNYADAETAYRKAAAIEPTPELAAKIASTAERMRDARLPAEFRAIAAADQITRADLAALLGIRLQRLVEGAAPQQIVITDITGHWAAPWITAVVRAGVMDPFENHTFQPALPLRRGDLAAAVNRVVARVAAGDAALRKRIAARPEIADMSSNHLSYPAAAVAVASGVMPLLDGNRFDVNGVVSGAEALAVVGRLQALVR